MPVSLTVPMTTHIGQEVTTLVVLWKVTLANSTVMGFTNSDVDIVYGGVTYLASTGYSASNVSSTLDMAGGNVDIFGILDSANISEIDLIAGLYDGAIVECFFANSKNLIACGLIPIFKGEITEITCKEGKFTARVDDLSSYLNDVIGEVYSFNCRAKALGDARCKLNLAGYTHTGESVTGVASRRSFTASSLGALADHYFNYGTVTWLTGNNAGLSVDVKSFSSGSFSLFSGMPYDITVGDTFTAIAGCNRTPNVCINRFNNFVNYRGEPFLKGIDVLMEYAPFDVSGLADD